MQVCAVRDLWLLSQLPCVAKVRDYSTNSSMVIFKCDMDMRNASSRSRLLQYRDAALDYAFLLKAIGQPPVRNGGTESNNL